MARVVARGPLLPQPGGVTRDHTDAFTRARDRKRRGGGARKPLVGGAGEAGPGEMDPHSAPEELKSWVDRQSMLDIDYKKLDNHLAQLEKLYQKKSRPNFNDREVTANQREIDMHEKEFKEKVKEMKRELNGLVKDVEWENNDQLRLGEAMASEMSTQLHGRAMEFREIQQRYVRKKRELEKNLADQSPFATRETKPGEPDSNSMLQTMTPGIGMEEIQERDEEIRAIVASITEIAEMFSDLKMLVFEQGSIVDRIDYNLEVTSARTLKGVEHLEKAKKEQEKANNRTLGCISTMMTLITILMSAWIINKRYG